MCSGQKGDYFRGLNHRHAAVDVKGLTGDISGFIRSQVKGCGGYFVRKTQSSNRNFGENGFLLLGTQNISHGRCDEAGGHAIHCYVARRQFLGQ